MIGRWKPRVMAFVLGAIPFFLFAFGQRGVEPAVAILRVWSVYVPGIDKLSQTRTIPRRFRRDISGRESARVRDVCVEKCRLRDTPIMRRAICFRRAEWQRIKKTDLRYFHQNALHFFVSTYNSQIYYLNSLRNEGHCQFIRECAWRQSEKTCIVLR